MLGDFCVDDFDARTGSELFGIGGVFGLGGGYEEGQRVLLEVLVGELQVHSLRVFRP